MNAAKKGNLTSLTKINTASREELAAAEQRWNLRHQEEQRWEKAEESWTITGLEISQRVHNLREDLEEYRAQTEGVPFDILCCDVPRSVDYTNRKEVVELVEVVNPGIGGNFKMIDDYASEHGCHEFLDFNAKLFRLKWATAEAGFKIGVLAGAIFAGCSKETIDRFERGLTFALLQDPRVASD
jgi:hypothetical protein